MHIVLLHFVFLLSNSAKPENAAETTCRDFWCIWNFLMVNCYFLSIWLNMFIFILRSSLFYTQCSAEVLLNGFYLVGKHLLQLWVRSCGKSFWWCFLMCNYYRVFFCISRVFSHFVSSFVVLLCDTCLSFFAASYSHFKSEDGTVSSTTRPSSAGSGQTYTPSLTPTPTPTPSRTTNSNSPSNNAGTKTGESHIH